MAAESRRAETMLTVFAALVVLALVAVVLSAVPSERAAGQGMSLTVAGDLDKTFGIGGVITTGLAGLDSEIHGLAEQSDGKIVAVGYVQSGAGNRDFALARYNADGSLDTSFGTGGRVVTDISDGANDEARAVAIQSTGKIVVAGYSYVTIGGNSGNDFAVARYNTDGTLDKTFGKIVGVNRTGTLTINFGATDVVHAVAIQSDDKIVLAGQAGLNFGLMRLHPQGDPDEDVTANSYTGFGGNGRVTTSFTSNVFNVARAVAIQSDGKIVAAGYTSDDTNNTPSDRSDDETDFALARYTATGALDTAFSSDGKVVTSFGSSTHSRVNAVVIRSDGKIVAAGTNEVAAVHQQDGLMAVYNADGTLHTGFDTDGKLETLDPINALALGSSDSVYTAGTYKEDAGSFTEISVNAVDASGQYVAEFTNSRFGVGTTLVSYDQASGLARALVVRGDGRLVVAGYTSADRGSEFALVGLEAGSRLDKRFGSGGRGVVATSFASHGHWASGVAVLSNRFMVAVGSVANGSNGEDFALVGYSVGSLDTGFGTAGWTLTDFGQGEDRAFDVAFQPDGKIVVAGYATVSGDRDLAVARYLETGALDTSFGTGGKARIDAGSNFVEEGRAVAIQSDGKIVVAGLSYSDAVGTPGRVSTTLVCRLNTDGSTDDCREFDLDNADQDAAALDVAIQSDGKIVVAGHGKNSTGRQQFAVTRLNTNLVLDTTFGETYVSGGFTIGRGTVRTDFFDSGNSSAEAVAVQSDGKIVAAGYAIDSGTGISYPVMARYTSAGVLDTSFNSDGKVVRQNSARGTYSAVAVQSDDKIVAAGSVDYNVTTDVSKVLVARFGADGAPDTTFGAPDGSGGFTGRASTDVTGGNDAAYAMAVQPDGNIVVVGQAGRAWPDYDTMVDDRTEFLVARYLGRGDPSPDAALSALSVVSSTDGSAFGTSVALSPAFARDTTSYVLGLDAAATHVKVTATARHPAATVSVQPTGAAAQAVTSGAASAAIAAPSGFPVNVVVTAEDGNSTSTYTLALPAAAVTLSAASTSVGEGAGSVQVTATLNRRAPSGGLSVPLTATGTATAGTDYVLPAAITIPEGQTSASATVAITDDEATEGNETIVLAATVSGWTVTGVTLTITDDDVHGVTLSTNSVSVFEGSTATYTVRLNTEPTAQVTVTPSSGTPAKATVSGALVFTASNWKTAQPVTVTGVDVGSSTVTHAVVSSDSDYSGVSAGSVGVTVAEVATKYSITSAVTVAERDSALLTVTLGQAAPAGGIAFSVAYDFSGGASRLDLARAPTRVAVDEGETAATLTVDTRHDEVVEEDEEFTVTVAADAAAQAAGWTAVSGQDTATVTITDDDTATAQVRFGTSGLPGGLYAQNAPRDIGSLHVPVVVNHPAKSGFTVDVEVLAESNAVEYADAQNPGDFRIPDKTVAFRAGSSVAYLRVIITNSAETATKTIKLRIADTAANSDLGRHYTPHPQRRLGTVNIILRLQGGVGNPPPNNPPPPSSPPPPAPAPPPAPPPPSDTDTGETETGDSDGDAEGAAPTIENIRTRDQLIADQENLLNAYRCMFDIDTQVVPGGCTDGQPAQPPTQPLQFDRTPTPQDIRTRDRLVADQENLLNVYRCMFDIDTQLVPHGCTNGNPNPPPPQDPQT